MEIVGDPGAPHLAWILHGILGRGRNFRTFARQVTQTWPQLRVLLPDLRCHGEAPPAAPPHDLAACARDLEALAQEHGAPDVVVGHSFGGKVALAWAQAAARPETVLWVLDSPPGRLDVGRIDLDLAQRSAQQGDPARILAILRTIPVPAPDREALRAPLREAGISEPVVQWLLTSTRSDEQGWHWLWDLDGVESMLRSYAATDFWEWLGGTELEVNLVRAERSDRWSERDLAELALVKPPVRGHVLPNAGHWLHVDNPAGLFELMRSGFAGRRGA